MRPWVWALRGTLTPHVWCSFKNAKAILPGLFHRLSLDLNWALTGFCTAKACSFLMRYNGDYRSRYICMLGRSIMLFYRLIGIIKY